MRRIKQEIYFPILIAIHFVIWWVDMMFYTGSYEYTSLTIAGEVFSSWVVTVFAANFLMATRAKWVEHIFGGLDKMYIIHRRAGVIAVVLLILHFIVVPRNPEFSIGKPMGMYAMVLILIGVVISAAPVFKRKIKYHRWLIIHKLMGLFYILGIAHSFYVPTLTSQLPMVRTYVYGMALIGIISWFYKAFLYNIFNKKLNYSIESVKHFTNDTTEINLKPNGNKLAYETGQFTFASFKGLNRSESHPFTISNHPKEGNLRLTIKALGDYTADLQNSIAEGISAKIQGAYGKFYYRAAKHKNQIWLAGGIGVTPFLSFIKDVNSEYDITFVWSLRTKDQANYKEEIETIISQKPFINFILWDTETKGYFSIDKLYNTDTIKKHSVFICGPEVMRESYIKQLLEKGMPLNEIHYEEFSFR